VAADGASAHLIAENTIRGNGSGVVLDVGTHEDRVVGNVIRRSAFEGIARRPTLKTSMTRSATGKTSPGEAARESDVVRRGRGVGAAAARIELDLPGRRQSPAAGTSWAS
jgi:hypothetical protein